MHILKNDTPFAGKNIRVSGSDDPISEIVKVERFQSFTSQSKISSKVNEYRSTDNSLNIARVHSPGFPLFLSHQIP